MLLVCAKQGLVSQFMLRNTNNGENVVGVHKTRFSFSIHVAQHQQRRRIKMGIPIFRASFLSV
jgi:hypothetical protein